MYLSIIVNNRMDIIANLAFRGKTTVEIEVPCIVEDENGNKFQIQNDKISGTKEKMFYYECDIVRPNISQSLDDTFIKNVESIIKKAIESLLQLIKNLLQYIQLLLYLMMIKIYLIIVKILKKERKK